MTLTRVGPFSRIRLLIPLALAAFFVLAGAFPVTAEEDDLAEALKSGKKTIEFSGKENDPVKIRKGVRVIGKSPDKAVINDDVVMENGSSLENVTVNGKLNAIALEEGASVTLVNVTVRGSSEAGIFSPKGGGKLTLKNSRILKNRKGLYLLNGTGINLSGNVISDNDEEGADMHSGITGSITGNTFSGNGEGGLEIIINGSQVALSGNTFFGNGASGLALQTYAGGGGGQKTGQFEIYENTFSENGNFGIDCKNPQGGGANVHFRSSSQVRDNQFSENTRGTISGTCLFKNGISAAVEEEKEDGAEAADKADTEEMDEEEAVKEEEASAPITETANETYAVTLLADTERFRQRLEAEREKGFIQKMKEYFVGDKIEEELEQEGMRLRQLKDSCLVVATREVSLTNEREATCLPQEKEILDSAWRAIDTSLEEDSDGFLGLWREKKIFFGFL